MAITIYGWSTSRTSVPPSVPCRRQFRRFTLKSMNTCEQTERLGIER